MAKELRAREDTTRVLAKEEEKEVRSWASVSTAAVKDILQGTARTQERGSKEHASRVDEKDTVQLSAPREKAPEEEKMDT